MELEDVVEVATLIITLLVLWADLVIFPVVYAKLEFVTNFNPQVNSPVALGLLANYFLLPGLSRELSKNLYFRGIKTIVQY